MKPAPPVTTTFIELLDFRPIGSLAIATTSPRARTGPRRRDPTGRPDPGGRRVRCGDASSPGADACRRASARAPTRDVSRIYLSPPDVGPAEREALLDAFDGGWIAPVGPDVDAFEREIAAVDRHPSTPRPCRAAPPRCTWPCWPPGSDRATRCSCRPSPSWPPPARWCTSAPARPSSTASPAAGTSIPAWSPRCSTSGPGQGRLPAAVIAVDLYGQCADADALADGLPAATGSRSSRTRPRPSAPRTGAARPAPWPRSASSPSTATRSSPPAAAACSSPTTRRSWPAPATWPPRPANRRRTTSTPRSASTTA